MVYRPNKNCETDLLFCEVDTGRAMNLLLDYILYFLSDLSNGFIINTKNRDKLSFYLYAFHHVHIEFQLTNN